MKRQGLRNFLTTKPHAITVGGDLAIKAPRDAIGTHTRSGITAEGRT